MRLTVLFEDKKIGVNGVFYDFETLAPSNPNHRVIQFYPEGHGVIEVYKGDRVWLSNVSPVQAYIDEWTAKNQSVLAN